MCIYDDTLSWPQFFPLASLERHFYGTGTYGYYVGRRLERGCAVERYEVAFRVPTSEAARQKFFWLPWVVISYSFNLGQRRFLESYATLLSDVCIGARLYVIRNSGCTFCLCTSTFITSPYCISSSTLIQGLPYFNNVTTILPLVVLMLPSGSQI